MLGIDLYENNKIINMELCDYILKLILLFSYKSIPSTWLNIYINISYLALKCSLYSQKTAPAEIATTSAEAKIAPAG